MTCFSCKGDVEDRLTTFTVDIEGRVYIIKGVPSHVCKQCGAVSYSDEVMVRLEEMVSGMKNDVSDVAMATYKAA